MKLLIKSTSLILTLLLVCVCSVAHAQYPFFTKPTIFTVQEEHVPDEIIVKFKEGVSENIIDHLNSLFDSTIMKVQSRLGTSRIKIKNRLKFNKILSDYQNHPDVEYAEPNYIATEHMAPNDQYYSFQWSFNGPSGDINIEEAWEVSTGQESVVVAVIDTGVAYENRNEIVGFSLVQYSQASDLANTNFVDGYDFVNNDSHANDDRGHGTHVAGTIAQSTNNGIGVAGVAYDVTIMPVKVLDENGNGSYSDVADGIIWAADNGADVINLSLGGPAASTTLRNALEYAHNQGVTIVCSAGNDNSSQVGYPARYNQYCISTGATRYDETRAYYSNYGNNLDIVAPGGDLNVDQNSDGFLDGILQQTFQGNPNNFGYWFFQGTSMAAPHVSGVAALLISAGIATTPDQVRDVLESTAKDLGTPGWDPNFGWGLLDAGAALNSGAAENLPPTAAHGGPYTGVEGVPVQFDGSGSSDPENGNLTYRWDFGDGNVATGETVSHTYASGGSYMVVLIVNDGAQDSGAATTTATITEVNNRPTADPGGPYSGNEDEPIVFDGSGSSDPENDGLTYQWDFGDGQSGSGISPAHTYLNPGTYTVGLVVNDGQLNSEPVMTTATVAEVVVNDPPTADAGGPYNGDAGASIQFDGSGSSDPEGDPLTYSWDFGDGNTATGVNPTHAYAESGEYTVILVVNDGTQDSGPSSTTATIADVFVNTPPTADAGGPYNANEGESVQFDGSGSSDPQEDSLTYQWDFGDGNTGTGVSPTHTYAGFGTFTVTLTVNDGEFDSDPSEATVTISEVVVNNPPTADVGGPYSGNEDTSIQFDGSGSSDPEGDPLTYSWDFGDGFSGIGVSPTHTYLNPGNYTVTLIVNDGNQDSNPSSTTVSVANVNISPTADPGGPYNGTVNQSVLFDGSGSDDPDGNITNFAWDFGDGNSGSGESPSHTYASDGTYTVSLTVTDNEGGVDTQSTTVQVSPAPPQGDTVVFMDSFENGAWNGLWTEDSQDDFFTSTQRETDGNYSAEVDGRATDAALISIPIDLQGKTNATITFDWFIERKLDRNEYIAFDVSTNGGASWIPMDSLVGLSGTNSVENVWYSKEHQLNNISSLQIRFRARMSSSAEDANIDNVKVVAW